LAFTTATPENREHARALASRFRDLGAVTRVFDDSVANVRAQLAARDASLSEAGLFHRLAAHVTFTSPLLRSQASVVGNHLGQARLWPHAISGDLPIVLLRIGTAGGLGLTRQVLRSHAYWRWCGLVTDLVVLNDAGDELRRQLEGLVQSASTADSNGKPGGVYLLDAAVLSAEDDTLLEAAARVILRDGGGLLTAQLSSITQGVDESSGGMRHALGAGWSAASSSVPCASDEPASAEDERLLFENGLGGFTPDGREYLIRLRGGERPPAPWSNVLANPDFGCLVTEAGGGYTWAGNSQMNRLTPWSNDPVSDPPGEVLYLRDEETGRFWSATPAPCGDQATTIVRHGQGYSRFTRTSHGLEQDLLVLVAPTAPVKMFHLSVRNVGNVRRRLAATFYAEWVLGILRD
jgi:cyclic beta-1,2-glucan synthetase